jgi:hypothetical protein
VEISSKLRCLFSAEVSEAGDSHVVEVPRREIEAGTVEPGETYRVALVASDDPHADEHPSNPAKYGTSKSKTSASRATASPASNGAMSSSSPTPGSATG